MATAPQHHPISDEKTDAEMARLLEDPKLRAELEAEERAIESGNYVAIPHDEAMRVLGLDKPPLDGAPATSL